MPEASFYSTADVSKALGVSASTIKRWVDSGVLTAHTTAGGHRKIPHGELLRFVRQRNFPLQDLSLLNLGRHPQEKDTHHLSDSLSNALLEADVQLMRSVIHGAYAAGMSIEEIGDAVVAPAMHRLGDLWEKGRIDVMHEHRGTLLCVGILHELKSALEATTAKDRPIAVGGSPEGDHTLMGGLLVEMVLIDAGWRVVNLGPHTPLESFRQALRELHPRMIWLSATHFLDRQVFLQEYAEFHEEAHQAGVAIAIGGRGIDKSLRAMMPCTFHGENLTRFAAFARTLYSPPQIPRRGRPVKRMN